MSIFFSRTAKRGQLRRIAPNYAAHSGGRKPSAPNNLGITKWKIREKSGMFHVKLLAAHSPYHTGNFGSPLAAQLDDLELAEP